ncbi:MAG: hypothetical protein U0694_18690 [Anaerolineae bacterium]
MDQFTIARAGEIRHQEILDQAAQEQNVTPLWQSLRQWGILLITLVQKMVQTIMFAMKERIPATQPRYQLDPCIEQPENCG